MRLVPFTDRSLTLMLPLALVLGTIAGIRRGKASDHAIASISLGLIALPEFVSGTVLVVVFGVTLAWFPPTSIIPSGASPLNDPRLLVLPSVTLCLAGAAYIIRMLRAGVAEEMAGDYVNAVPQPGLTAFLSGVSSFGTRYATRWARRSRSSR